MFGCNNPQTVLSPSDAQKKINEDQLKFMKEKCEGKESCTAHATNSWWSTNHQCPGHEKAYMWLHWHCNGVGAKTNCAVDSATPSTPVTTTVLAPTPSGPTATTPTITTATTSVTIAAKGGEMIKKDIPCHGRASLKCTGGSLT